MSGNVRHGHIPRRAGGAGDIYLIGRAQLEQLPCFLRYRSHVVPILDEVRRHVGGVLSNTYDHGPPIILPDLSFSLLCFMPFWVEEQGSDSGLASVLSRINAHLLMANWIMDPVMNSEVPHDAARQHRDWLWLPLLSGSVIGVEVAQYGLESELSKWLTLNITALVREQRMRDDAFRPYFSIWKKIAIAMLSCRTLVKKARLIEFEYPFRSFLAHYQMMDEFLDLFDDLRSGAPNQLRRHLNATGVARLGSDFWRRYVRHGQTLSKCFLADARQFQRLKFQSLEDFCVSRVMVIEDRLRVSYAVIHAGDELANG